MARLKMAVLAPMPRASVRMAMAVKAGLLRSMRRLKRMSCQNVCIGPPGSAAGGIYEVG